MENSRQQVQETNLMSATGRVCLLLEALPGGEMCSEKTQQSHSFTAASKEILHVACDHRGRGRETQNQMVFCGLI